MARKLRGNTTMGMVNAGIAERNAFKPKIGTTITMGTPIKETMIGSSYGNIVGGSGGLAGKGMGGGGFGGGFDGGFGGGFGGGLPSMGQLEASSMRLADAASRRGISEKEAEAELGAKSSGYSSLDEMQRDIRSKRQEQERKEKQQEEDDEMRRQGYVKRGGQWIMPVRG